MRSRPIVPWKSEAHLDAVQDVAALMMKKSLLNPTILWIPDAQTVKLFHLRLRQRQCGLSVLGAENQALANHLKRLFEFCETVPPKMKLAVGHELVLLHGVNWKRTEAGSDEMGHSLTSGEIGSDAFTGRGCNCAT